MVELKNFMPVEDLASLFSLDSYLVLFFVVFDMLAAICGILFLFGVLAPLVL